MKDLIISVLESQAVQTLIVGGVVYLLGKLFVKEPKVGLFFEKYKGAMIKGIKLAEAEIPDDTQNKSLVRLDRALQYTIQLIEIAENRKVTTEAELAQIKSDISAVHHEVIDGNN